MFDQKEIDGFAECCDSLELCDASSLGFFLTWNNKQKGALRMWAKLDRVLLHSGTIQSK